MEYLNKIHLKGTIGSINKSGHFTEMSICVVEEEKDIRNINDTPLIHNTWFAVILLNTALNLQKGQNVEILGRLRARRSINASGGEYLSYEVLAQEVNILSN